MPKARKKLRHNILDFILSTATEVIKTKADEIKNVGNTRDRFKNLCSPEMRKANDGSSEFTL